MIWSFTLSLAAIYKQHKRFWQIVGWGYNCKAHYWEAWNLEKQYGSWEIVSCHRSCVQQQQQQQQSGVMSVSEGLCTWVQLQVNHHFRLKICNKNLLYCGMCQVQAILPMDKPGRVSLVGWAKQAEWLVPGMFRNIMVFRICTSGFIQWACVDYTMGICGFCRRVCGFWTMVRYGRWPKKMCPLCLVRGLNRGRKSDMKTIMLKTKSNPQKTEVSKTCWRNNLRTNFHNKFSSLKTGLSNEVHILLMSTRTTKVKWKCQCTTQCQKKYYFTTDYVSQK